MGKISKGILGGFSGTVGTVVGGSWNGIDYMRSLPKPTSKAATQIQTEQRARFSVVVKFIQAFAAMVASTFKDSATGMTGFNKAMAHSVKAAITGAYPNYKLDYSQILLSRGSLPNGNAPKVASAAAGQVTFTWGDNTGLGKATANDPSVLAVYCEELNLAVYTLTGASRHTATATLAVPGFSGKAVQTWMAFLSADGKDIATSIYTGQLNVQ